jgi:hypothetical protein
MIAWSMREGPSLIGFKPSAALLLALAARSPQRACPESRSRSQRFRLRQGAAIVRRRSLEPRRRGQLAGGGDLAAAGAWLT